jgi:hypothetical protein
VITECDWVQEARNRGRSYGANADKKSKSEKNLQISPVLTIIG